MRTGKALLTAIALLSASAAWAQETPRQINITQGSQPGWIPSEELESEVLAAWASYYAYLDMGEYEAAHAMLSEELQSQWPLEAFVQEQERARAERGAVNIRKPMEINWTNNSPAAPTRGLYVAIDTDAQFDKARRFCGFTILHRPEGADQFRIARIEENVLSDAAAEQIASGHSAITPELIWHLVARNCPNYEPAELPESINEGTGFSSVSAARQHVEALPEIETATENGWTVISDLHGMTAWSFSPEGSPYHPSVIKRSIRNAPDGTAKLDMAMRCEASKPACDALFVEMAARNGLLPVTFE